MQESYYSFRNKGMPAIGQKRSSGICFRTTCLNVERTSAESKPIGRFTGQSGR